MILALCLEVLNVRFNQWWVLDTYLLFIYLPAYCFGGWNVLIYYHGTETAQRPDPTRKFSVIVCLCSKKKVILTVYELMLQFAQLVSCLCLVFFALDKLLMMKKKLLVCKFGGRFHNQMGHCYSCMLCFKSLTVATKLKPAYLCTFKLRFPEIAAVCYQMWFVLASSFCVRN